MDVKTLAPALAKELLRRSIDKGADNQSLLENLVAHKEHIFVGGGDGEVTLLVPYDDAYEVPSRIEVKSGDGIKMLDTASREADDVVIDGVKFARFVLNPLAYGKKLSGPDADIAIRGINETTDAVWSPLGYADNDYFKSAYEAIRWLATSDEMMVAPEVRVDPRDPSWKELDDAQRKALSKALGRPVGRVIHESDIERALHAAGADDEIIKGALKGIALSLDAETPASQADDAVFTKTEQLVAAARPAIEKVLGTGALDSGAYPKGLLEVAISMLEEQGAFSESEALRRYLGGNEDDLEEVDAALDRAFGEGFASGRRPPIEIVEHVYDSPNAAQLLSLEQIATLQDLIGQLDYEMEVLLRGEEATTPPLSTESSDKALKELFQKIIKGTGLPETQVFQVATRLQSAVNTPTGKPQILILAGAKGSGVDELYQRVKRAAEGDVVEFNGSNDLRLTDPMGRILGSPNGEAGLVASSLLQKNKDKRLVLCVDGAESIGTAQQYDEDTEAAQRSFYAGMAQLQKTGSLRAYDGDGGEQQVSALGGLVIVRDRRSLDELKSSIPPSLWSQLAPQIIDFGTATSESVLSQLQASIANHMKKQFGVVDADVQMSAEAQNFLRELLEDGADAEMIQSFVQNDVLPRIMRAAYDEDLGSKIRIEFSRGVRPKHLEIAKKAWAEGKQADLPGIGTLFSLRDEGRFRAESSFISAKLEKRLSRDRQLEQLKLTILGYQSQLQGANDDILKLMREVKGRTTRIEQLDEHVAVAEWRNAQQEAEITDLKRLHRLANEAIEELKATVDQLNKNIENGNKSIEKLKGANSDLVGKVEQAVLERDEIKRALRQLEDANGGLLRGLADALTSGRNAHQIFDAVRGLAPVVRKHPHIGNLLEVMLDMGLNQAFQTALEYQERNFGKFEEIADLAGDYISASFAAGIRPRQDVLDGLHQVARVTGDGINSNLNQKWNDTIARRAGLGGAGTADLNEALAWYEQQQQHTHTKFRDPGKVTQFLRGILNKVGIGV